MSISKRALTGKPGSSGEDREMAGRIWWEDDVAATSASRASFILRTWLLSTLACSSAKAQHNRGKGQSSTLFMAFISFMYCLGLHNVRTFQCRI